MFLVSPGISPQVCSRDEAALRSRTQSGGRHGRRGLPSSLRTLDRLSSRASGHSTSQVIHRTGRPLLGDMPCFLYRHRKRRHLRVRAAEPAPSCLFQRVGRKHLQISTPHCSEPLERSVSGKGPIMLCSRHPASAGQEIVAGREMNHDDHLRFRSFAVLLTEGSRKWTQNGK